MADYSGTSKDRLTALINTDNETTLVEGTDFTYGQIEVVLGDSSYNTQVKLIADPSTEKSDVKVKYNRLPITAAETLAGAPITLTELTFPLTMRDLITEINVELNLDLDPSEIEDTEYLLAPEDDIIVLTIAPNSMGWIEGSTIDIGFTTA